MINHLENVLIASQQKVAADVLASAFAQDTFMTYLFPNAATREKNLAKLFFPVIRCAMLNECYTTKANQGISCDVTLVIR